ncbi:MAG: type III-B CRISPR module-associated protein Cmr5 [Bacteroidota bacterium]
MASNRNKLEHGRASVAMVHAEAARQAGKLKEYASLAKRTPMLIKTNGLGAALAFIKAKRNASDKSRNEHRMLYEDLKSWLADQRCPLPLPPNTGDLVAYLIELDSPDYRAYTLETLAYLTWVRRFSEGLSKD